MKTPMPLLRSRALAATLLLALLPLARWSQAACSQISYVDVDDRTGTKSSCTQGTTSGITWTMFTVDTSGGTTCNSSPTCGRCGCQYYPFAVVTPGVYQVSMAVSATTGSSDEVDAQLLDNGGAGVNDTNTNNGLIRVNVVQPRYFNQWTEVTQAGNADGTCTNVRSWNLSPGNYTMYFRGKDPDFYMDKIRVRLVTSLATPTFTPTIAPTPAPLGTGLCANYYKNMALSGTANTVRVDAQVNNSWGTTQPSGTTVGSDGYSVRWTGQIEFPYTGFWTLYTQTDDGVRLYIDGVPAIDNWTDHSLTENLTTTTRALGKHDIILEYYENTGDATAILLWELPGVVAKAAVPQNRLYNSSCAAATPTRSPTPGAGGTTPTYTPTPTLSPTPMPPTWQGLVFSQRLYNIDYIPFPPQSGAGTFYDLSRDFTSLATSTQPKNTARWRISFQNLQSDIGLEVAIETRIGPMGVTCMSGSLMSSEYASATSIPLPQRPQNLSTTYLWLDAQEPPITESYDAVGDPRMVPYLDNMDSANGGSGSLASGYNWFFKDLSVNSNQDYRALFSTLLARARNNGYNGGPNVDVPRLFKIWRDAVTHTRSVYTSMTGFSAYYIGLGGEIGGDSANKLSLGGVPASNYVYGGTGNVNINDITGASVLVRSSTLGVWNSLPFLGELWPDSAYRAEWEYGGGMASYGNLRNSQSSGSWVRDTWPNCDSWGGTSYVTHFNVRHITADRGCASFLNGNGGSNVFGHYYEDNSTGTRLLDGAVMASDYNFSINPTFNVSRPWGLNASATAPPSWSLAPYSTHLALDIFSCSTVTAGSRGFYSRQAAANSTTDKSSATIRGYDSAPSNTDQRVGFFVVNGLAPSTDTGINYMARFALLTCLRAFQDAGTPTNVAGSTWSTRNIVNGEPYRIEPIPLVQIYAPNVGQDLAGQSVIAISWKERYARWDGKRYTENYPCLDVTDGSSNPNTGAPCGAAVVSQQGDPNREWHSAEPLLYNVKYSGDGGANWISALTGATTTAGTMLENADAIYPTPGQHDLTYSWNVSAITPGTKLVRVECFRQNIHQHYAYHELKVKVNP